MLRSSLAAALALGSLLCAANVAIADDAKPVSQPAAARDRSCLRDTGSRIPVKGSECKGVGRSYSKQDVDLTGKSTAGGALRMMDITGR
jgi:hypothetical protein